MRIPILIAFPLLALIALLITPVGAEGVFDLRPERIRVKHRGARDAVKFRARFASEYLPAGYDPGADGLSLRIGDATVLTIPAAGARSKLTRKSDWRWKYRERRSKDRPGVRALRLDTAAGNLRFTAKRLDLDGVEAGGVTVTLVLGETTFSGEAALSARGRRLTFRAPKPGLPPPSPPGPPSDAPGEAIPFRVVAGGADCFVWGLEKWTVRTDAEWLSLYYRWNGDPPPLPAYPDVIGGPPRPEPPPYEPPPVDFGTEMVFAVFLGERPTGGYAVRVTSVERIPGGLRVTYEETRPPSGCPVTQALTRPFAIVACERTIGGVLFRSEVVAGCR